MEKLFLFNVQYPILFFPFFLKTVLIFASAIPQKLTFSSSPITTRFSKPNSFLSILTLLYPSVAFTLPYKTLLPYSSYLRIRIFEFSPEFKLYLGV
jgi:hypothetical protein